jgi:hypothetical protein
MAAEWFYKVADREIGPLAVPQLKAMAQRGSLRPEDLVRRGTEGKWLPAGRIKGLFPEPGASPAKGKSAADKGAPKTRGKPAVKIAQAEAIPVGVPIADTAEAAEPAEKTLPVEPQVEESDAAAFVAPAPAPVPKARAKPAPLNVEDLLPPSPPRKPSRSPGKSVRRGRGGRPDESGESDLVAQQQRRQRKKLQKWAVIGGGAVAAVILILVVAWGFQQYSTQVEVGGLVSDLKKAAKNVDDLRRANLNKLIDDLPKADGAQRPDLIKAARAAIADANKPAPVLKDDTEDDDVKKVAKPAGSGTAVATATAAGSATTVAATTAATTSGTAVAAKVTTQQGQQMLVLEVKDPKLTVKVMSAQLGLPANARLVGGKAPDIKPLTITIQIENLDPTKKISMRPWGAGAVATLKDEHGNDYRETVPAAAAPQSIYPSKPHLEFLVFEPPVEAAKTLILQLPAAVFGGSGNLRFELPRTMITVAETPPAETLPKAAAAEAVAAPVAQTRREDPDVPPPLENVDLPRGRRR